MKPLVFFTFLLIIMTLSCKSTKSKTTEAQINALENLVESKSYTIESNLANPQITNAMQQVLNSGILQPGSSANAINLIGNPNFLTISNDSVSAHLPYFGERQMHFDYGGRDGGIKLNGLIEDYTLKKGKNNRFIIEFNARNKMETFNINILLFPNLNSEIIVNSSSRFPISYIGKVERVEINE